MALHRSEASLGPMMPAMSLMQMEDNRLRKISKKMPDTKLQMLLRGQNILGYKHPHLGGVVASLVHGLQNRLELVVGQTGSDQRLVCVTKHGLREVS